MKIGINALSLAEPKVGVHYYIINLVKHLIAVDSTNQYLIFITPEMKGNFAEFQNLCVIRVGQARKLSFLCRVFKEQFFIPFLLRKHQIDIYHCLDHILPIFIPTRHAVVTVHDLTFLSYKKMHSWGTRLYFPNFIEASLKKAERIICVSETTKRDVVSYYGVPTQKIKVIHHGIGSHFHTYYKSNNDSRVKEVKQRYNIEHDFFLFVGTLEPRKNILTLIRAFYDLGELRTKYNLVIAGKKGWQFSEIFELVGELSLEDRVVFTGYVPDDVLVSLYNGARIFVYPSYYEGFGLPPLEAMACGTPTIVSNTSTLPEIVGSSALQVDPNNVKQLKQAILKILTDRKLEKNLIKKGLQNAKKFTWHKSASEMLNTYNQLLSSE